MKTTNIKKLLILLLSTSLFSQTDGVYVEIGAGNTINTTLKSKNGTFKYESGLSTNLAIGYQIDLYRFEFEGKQTQNSLYSYSTFSSSGDYKKQSQMINAYYSGYNGSPLFTTIGLGLGISNIKLTNMKQFGVNIADITNSGIFSAQAIVSIGYMITEHIATSVKYNYLYTTKSKEFDAEGDNIFSFTLRYLF